MNIKHRIPASLALVFLAVMSSCSQTSNPAATASHNGTAASYHKSQADIVVLSFFDMYCPHCQRSADDVNQLHAMVQKRGQNSRIAFYAIGTNNTPMEASMYQKRYNVPFPVQSDRDRSITSQFNNVTPPLLIALKKQGGQWKEFYRTDKIQGQKNSIYAHIQP